MTSTRVEDFKLEDWLPYWINPNDLIALLAALAVLVAFLAIWQALRPADPFQRRYSQVMSRREGLRQEGLDSKRPTRTRVTAPAAVRDVGERPHLLPSQSAQDARILPWPARGGV